MSAEIEILTAFYAAINRNEIDVLAAYLDPSVLRLEPEGHLTAGTYRGVSAVLEHVKQGRGTWAEGSCDPEKFVENGDKVVVFLHAWVRKQGATEWMGGRFADGFVFHAGKIVEFRTFWKRSEALTWAGLEGQPES